jgi:hypothetical protein
VPIWRKLIIGGINFGWLAVWVSRPDWLRRKATVVRRLCEAAAPGEGTLVCNTKESDVGDAQKGRSRPISQTPTGSALCSCSPGRNLLVVHITVDLKPHSSPAPHCNQSLGKLGQQNLRSWLRGRHPTGCGKGLRKGPHQLFYLV